MTCELAFIKPVAKEEKNVTAASPLVSSDGCRQQMELWLDPELFSNELICKEWAVPKAT